MHGNFTSMIYFLAKKPVPIFNTFDLNRVFGGKTGKLLTDDRHQVAQLEMIAFLDTVFHVVGSIGDYILQVELKQYPATYPLFIDRRFGEILNVKLNSKLKIMPSQDIIIERLIGSLGTPYVWGGNKQSGCPDIIKYYPPQKKHTLSHIEKNKWIFRGLDCSGLLFEATEGITPRNTSSLLFYGKPVCIEGKDSKEIAKVLKPLDLVVYNGHVVIVLNDKEMIESRLSAGRVVKVQSEERLKELIEKNKKIPCDDPSLAIRSQAHFLIRRFFS